MRAGRNIGRGRANRAAVFDDHRAGGNRAQRDLVPAWNRLDDGHRRLAAAKDLTGIERVERRRDVVLVADHDGRIHWFTPLARNPPSTARTCPVTKLGESDAGYTAAPT